MKKTDPNVCVLKTCTRWKDGPGALCCPAHWKLVPRKLKLALWAGEKTRSPSMKAFLTMCAADDILTYLEKLKVQLPPEVKLAKPESELETPTQNEPRILRP